ncbi:hypothetical protein M3936_14165 [Sutcliffiella horikoshii]|uniref:hypothetical protein n=1 Tax=Sutcliffiella horikoshii TaxID=79883 RepID=UPI00203DBC5E|nr:hypothetical protein [Sutcliffiella horikoshii]MCM3618732.1 hypothetical protein [Sutcliffiella horikoshii]
MIGKVTEWKMTPEELDAYRKKYPPKPDQTKLRKRGQAFADIHTYGNRRKKNG